MKILLDTEDKIEEVPIIGTPVLGVIQGENRGRPNGRQNLPELSKDLIRADREAGMKVEDVAKVHGVAPSSVTQASKLSSEKKNKIIEVTSNKLLESLEIFEPSALDQNELPAAAARLAGIVEKIQDKEIQEGGNNVQFIVVSPGLRREDEYRTIEVKD